MAGFSNYLENKILEHIVGKTAYVMPAGVYVALFTSLTDAEAGTGTEVAGNGYARTQATFGAAVNGAITNSVDITFPNSTGNWGTVGFVGIYDAATGGNYLTGGALQVAKTVASGDSFKIAVGSLSLTLD